MSAVTNIELCLIKPLVSHCISMTAQSYPWLENQQEEEIQTSHNPFHCSVERGVSQDLFSLIKRSFLILVIYKRHLVQNHPNIMNTNTPPSFDLSQ